MTHTRVIGWTVRDSFGREWRYSVEQYSLALARAEKLGTTPEPVTVKGKIYS